MGAALVVLTVALSGCLSLKSNQASQTTPGRITLKVVVCASNYSHVKALPDWTDCQPGTAGRIVSPDVNREDSTKGGFGQLLVGFRVPLGTVAPSAFSSKDGATDFTLSASYTTELQRLFRAPGDQQWVGYISTVKEYKPAVAASRVGELNVDFRLPKSADGAPLTTFRWRPVVGFRQGGNADAPVSCCNDAVGKYCVDSPPRGQMSDDITTEVTDFGVLPGASATAYAGTTARLPFQLRYSDKAALGRETFSLTATTELPNASASAAPRTIDAAPNSTNAASVLVPVPAGTPGGRYTVTLSAATGVLPLTRVNTGTVFVQPLPPGPAPLPINSPVENIWNAKRSGTRVTRLEVTKVPAGGAVTVRCLRGGRSCAFRSKTIKKRRTVTLTKLFRHRKLRLRTVVEVNITAPQRIGKLIRYTVRKGRIPAKRTLCEPPGAPKPLPCD